MVVAVGEAFPPEDIINQQDGHNEVGPEESSLNVTNKVPKKKKYWWPHWSSDEKQQDQSTKLSDKEDPTIHNLPPVNYEVINKLYCGDISGI